MLVLKIGGSLGLDGVSPVLDDVAALWASGHQLVLVHGGGRMVTEYAERLGVKQRFFRNPSGFTTRLTDRDTVRVFEMVMAGLYNKELVAGLLRRGVRAVGLSGVDGGLVKGVRKRRILVIDERGRKRFIYGDYSGRPTGIERELLSMLLNEGFLPVIAPIGVDEEGNVVNMDGDRVAALIAQRLGAERLVILTDVSHLLLDGRPVESMSLEGARAAMERVEGGMKRKLLASVEALEGGVGEVVIASGLKDKPVFSALNHDGCTVVSGYG